MVTVRLLYSEQKSLRQYHSTQLMSINSAHICNSISRHFRPIKHFLFFWIAHKLDIPPRHRSLPSPDSALSDKQAILDRRNDQGGTGISRTIFENVSAVSAYLTEIYLILAMPSPARHLSCISYCTHLCPWISRSSIHLCLFPSTFPG